MQRVSVHPINDAVLHSDTSMQPSMDTHLDIDVALNSTSASSSSAAPTPSATSSSSAWSGAAARDASSSSPYARRARYRYLPSLSEIWLPTSLCGLLLLYPLLVIYGCCFVAALVGGLVLNVEGQWASGVQLLILSAVQLSHLSYGLFHTLEEFAQGFMHGVLPMHLALTVGFGVAVEVELRSHYGWIAPAAVAAVWILILLRIACARGVHSLGDMITVFGHWRYNEARLVRAQIPDDADPLIAPPQTRREQRMLGESR